MSKKVLISTFFFLISMCVIVQKVYADDTGAAVLGSNTQQLSLPPTTEGPGLLLPDSPFYFLDILKQDIRLFFASTPEAKSLVYNKIAGERLAEVRFELAKNNIPAADVALLSLRENEKNAAESIAEAKLDGKNVTTLADEINTSVNERQHLLDSLDNQATGEMKAEVDFIQASLSSDKTILEGSLSKEQLSSEVKDDLNWKVAKLAAQTSDAAKKLQANLNILQQQASQTAQSVINGKNSTLKKSQGIKSTEDKSQLGVVQVLGAQAVQQVQDIAQKAQEVEKTIEQQNK